MEQTTWAVLVGGACIAAWSLNFAVGLVIIIGAIKMMRLRSYKWAVAASILALLPCNPAALLGLVMGVWSLAVLHRPAVRKAFQAASLPGPGAQPAGAPNAS